MSDMVLTLRITADGRIAVEQLSDIDAKVKSVGGSAAAAGAAGAAGLKHYADGAKGAADAQGSMTASVFKGVGAMEVARRVYDEAVQVFHEMVAATEQAQQSHARLQAVLQATGGVAGHTADDIERLVQNLTGKTIFDDTQLRNAATTLATFDRLSGEAFDHVLKLAADLASTGRGDLETWVEALGKAGSEPTTSLMFVERAFGKLSPQVKIAIRDAADFNDQARAQKLLMEALSAKVEGTAASVYRGLTKQIEGTKKAWDDLLIAMGNIVFESQRTQASHLEQALRTLKQTLEEGDWFQKLWEVLVGNQRAAAGGYNSSIDRLIYQLQGARKALVEAQAIPGPWGTAALEQRIKDLEARIAAARAADARTVKNYGPEKFYGEGETGLPESVPDLSGQQDDILKLQRQQLHLDQLHGLSAYLDQVYALRQQGTQRELAIEQFKHDAFLESDKQYYANVERIQQQQAEDEVARLQSAIALQQQVVAQARADVARVSKGDHPPEEITAARQREQAEDGKLLGLKAQLADAENKVGDAARTRSQNETLANIKLQDELTTINRSYEDYLKNLDRSVESMALEVDLIGKDAEAQAKARKENELLNAAQDLRNKLAQQWNDEMMHARRPEVLDAITKQMIDLNSHTQQAIDKWDELISKQFRKQAIADLSSSLADAILTGGEQGLDGIKAAFEDYFKKPIKIQLEAQLNKLIGGALDNVYSSYASATGLSLEQAQQQLGLYGALGGVFGGAAAGGAGAGRRGTALAASYGQAGAMAGAYLGAQYGSIGGGWGAAIGAVIGAVAGYASDPQGLANRSATFGYNPQGNYSFQGRDAFGTFGTFNDRWFSGQDMGQQMRQFMSALATTENTFAALLNPQELARVQSSLSGWSAQYDFGKEHGDFSEALTAITKDRMAKMIEALMPGFGHLIQESQGTAEELVNLAQAILGLRDAGKSIRDAITQITGTAADQAKLTLANLDKAVSTAQSHLDAALNANDATKIYAAEQELTQAVLSRYQQEMSMVRQVQATIRQLEQQAYQFSLNIAQRIASMGGPDTSGSIAMGRATSLHDRILGNEPTNFRAEDVQSYVGAIDDWYNARKTQIEADAQSQAEAYRAIIRAQESAAQARLTELQKELDLAKSFQGVVDRTQQMLDDLRLSGANPMSIYGRIGLAHDNIESLKARYDAAQGQDRVDLANKLLDAIQTYEQLGQQGYQRPSPQWQAIYNEVAADLSSVQKDAKSYAEQSVDLQAQILDVQKQIQDYQRAAAGAAGASSSALNALNAEALPYYQWAQQQGEAAFAQQEEDQRQLLMAITGGTDPELFIAARQQESVDLLKSIDSRLAAWLAATGNPAGDTAGDSGGGKPGGTTSGASVGGGPNPLSRPKASVQVSVTLNAGVSVDAIPSIVHAEITKRLPAIKKQMANA